MFTDLLDNVFPVLGEIFAKLAYIANTPFEELVQFINYNVEVELTNFFNGQAFIFVIDWSLLSAPFQGVLALILDFLNGILPLSIKVLPTWICLLSMSLTIFFLFYLVRFFTGMIDIF